MKQQLDKLLADGVTRGDVPGVVAVAFNRDGLIYEGAFGERALGSGSAMTLDTVGAIFSMTKPVTGAAAMQLVEQGKLNLDTPAGEICPDLAKTQVLDGWDGDKPVLRAPKTPITLRHLLTHTSGFVYEVWNKDYEHYLASTGTPSARSRELAGLQGPTMFDPGDRWEYGSGIDWAGQMVEAVSGMTLGAYFKQHLTGPLGMNDTVFAPTSEMSSRLAGMHSRLPDGSLSPMELLAPKETELEMGGGGLFSTLGDYSRFCRMVLNGGELDGTRVMSAATVDAMGANAMGDLRVNCLKSAMPGLSNDAEFFPGDEKSWGLTFQINEQPGFTGRPAGTLMWAGLANCFFWIDRTNGIGGAYLSQIFPFADQQSLQLFYDFESAVYQAL